MSDDWIILIPERAGYVPHVEKQQQAMKTFQKIAPTADEIEIQLSDKIRFVDCGGNFSNVFCPVCGNELGIAWWQKHMEKDYDSSFQLQPIKLPCCGVMRNLHELRYHWQQGFAKFSLEAMNPNLGKLDQQHIASFEAILGCPVRVIYCHN